MTAFRLGRRAPASFDLADFDAVFALSEGIFNGEVIYAEFVIVRSPPGFDAVEAEVGRATPLQVYEALVTNGYAVS
jgi:hypothetical protein